MFFYPRKYLSLLHPLQCIYLKDFSKYSQDFYIFIYLFIFPPQFIIIQPNYGFGRINGSQSVKLHILYSPIVELLERSGQSVRHVFSLYCTTVDRLVCEPPNVVIRFDEEEENKTHSVFVSTLAYYILVTIYIYIYFFVVFAGGETKHVFKSSMNDFCFNFCCLSTLSHSLSYVQFKGYQT